MLMMLSNKAKRAVARLVIFFVILMLMVSPFFYFTDITLSGNFQIEDEEILNRARLDRPVNFFLFNPRRVRRDIMENPYIDQVSFRRALPGTLEISIRERFLSGYIEYLEGMFLYIDENGRVLEVRSYMKEDLPVITGLRFSHIHVGEILEADNPEAFSTVVTFARLLNRHELIGTISQIDVSDPANTRLRLYNIEVYLGDTRHAHEKILTLREIVNEWPVVRDARGFLDLRELNTEYIFRNLT
jgi:hypothetical protein